MIPTSPATPVGALKAQMDSYAKSIITKVLSCEPSRSQKGAYDVVFEDSVLFPEGGGQPADHGTLNDTINVLNVQRVKDQCVITADAALSPGAEVSMKVDWERRLDHMHHHSAQHLLTAVVEQQLGLPTLSWSLSHPFCFICLPAATVPDVHVSAVEQRCNELIASGTRVDRRTYSSRADVPPARSRSIPADFDGPIRLIDIDGIDVCACCGTHVNSLSELHMIKLLHQETKAGTCKLHFITGARLSAYFSSMFSREKQLMKELGCAPSQFLQNVARRGQESSEFQKKSKKLLSEVATLIGPSIAEEARSRAPPVFLFLREDADMDFLLALATHFAKICPQQTALLAAGSLQKQGEGQLMIVGSDLDRVAKVADMIRVELDAKGAQSKLGYRGKGDLKMWKAFVKKISTITDLW